jgi:hypothetical protein
LLLEVPQTLATYQPRGVGPRPLAAFHPLIQEVWSATRTFPRREPLELGPGLRGAALGAAEAVLQSCLCQDDGRAAALAAAASRLRELGCCLEIARQLGYLQTARCVEIGYLLAGAHDSISLQAARARAQGPGRGPRSFGRPLERQAP